MALSILPRASSAAGLPPTDVDRIDTLRAALREIRDTALADEPTKTGTDPLGLARRAMTRAWALHAVATYAQEALDADDRAMGQQDAAQIGELERNHARRAAHYTALLREVTG